MTVFLLPNSTPSGLANGADDFDHLWCCDPAKALCGANIADDEEIHINEDLENPCPLCEAINGAGVKCATKGCPA